MTRSAYNLGMIYGIAAYAARELASPDKLSAACKTPLSALHEAITTLIDTERMTQDIDDRITNLAAEVNPDMPAELTNNLQGAWWAGYYAAKGGNKTGEISLSEYAAQVDKPYGTVHQKAVRGGFKTAHKIGNKWVIDANEPYYGSKR